ncbi:MAG: hypothetical protein AAGJ31_07645, partial [Verrucomicrobiota bacterium]
METAAHLNLKRAALLWAQEHGYQSVGWEIRVPKSSYRADVAAYRSARQSREVGSTALFECKQARSDFLRDHHDGSACLERFSSLNARRSRLERLLRIHHPTLRGGDSLFQDFESVDLSQLPHRGYQTVRRELASTQRALFGGTKLHKMVRWKCANLFYLVAPSDLIRPEELPSSWALLSPPKEADLQDLSAPPPPLTLHQRPHWVDAPEPHRLQLVERIARRTTLFTNREAQL